MAHPFTLTLLASVDAATYETPRKPGWHKRAVAGDRAAMMRPRTAAQFGTDKGECERKALIYARWLLARDGVDLAPMVAAAVADHNANLPMIAVRASRRRSGWIQERAQGLDVAPPRPRVDWAMAGKQWRPCSVTWEVHGHACAVVAYVQPLPSWDWEPGAVVEVHAQPWEAPQVVEVTGAARAALLAALADADAALWVEAVADCYPAPAAWAIDGTDPEALDAIETPSPSPAPGGGSASPTPVEAIPTTTPVEAIPAPKARPRRTHTVVALCLTDGARDRLLATVRDGAQAAPGRDAPGGAWLVTVDDAAALQPLPAIRLLGMPKRRPAHLDAPGTVAPPVEAIAPRPPVEAIPHPAFTPRGGRSYAPVTLHAAP